MSETALTRMDNVVLGSIRGGNSSSHSPMPGCSWWSARRPMRCAASKPKLIIIDFRVAAGSRCSGASQWQVRRKRRRRSAPSPAEIPARQISCVKAKNSRSQCIRNPATFDRQVQIFQRRFDLDNPDVAARIHRHQIGAPPDGSVNSLTQEKPSDLINLDVPRAIARCVGLAAIRRQSRLG